MTPGRHGRAPGLGLEYSGPVGDTRRLQRGGSSMDRGSFTDRVMSRVATEPTPSPGRVLARSVRHLAFRDALAALAAAWRLAFEPASPVAASARASAAALFLSVIIVVGIGGAFVTGGALSLLGSDGTVPQQLAPGAAPQQSPTPISTPSPSPRPSASAPPSPAPTVVASPSVTQRARSDDGEVTKRATPEPKERRSETREKRETPEPEGRDRDERDERDEREGDDD